jgi:hypothetical protein
MVRPNKKSWLAGWARARKKKAGQDDSFLPSFRAKDRIDRSGRGQWAVRQEGGKAVGWQDTQTAPGNGG